MTKEEHDVFKINFLVAFQLPQEINRSKKYFTKQCGLCFCVLLNPNTSQKEAISPEIGAVLS